MPDIRYLGEVNPDELRSLGKDEIIKRLNAGPAQQEPTDRGTMLGEFSPEELRARMHLHREKAREDYINENFESRNVLDDTAAALGAGAVDAAQMAARAVRAGREKEKTPNLTKFIEGTEKLQEESPYLKPSRDRSQRKGAVVV
jgi:hypothetical protein